MQFKYSCDNCDFHTQYNSTWIKHIETELHKTGKRKTRSDKIKLDKCPNCEYVSTSKGPTTMKQHILNEHRTKEVRKKEFKYYCEYCDYGTFAESFQKKHNETEKHKHIIEIINLK